MDKEMEIAGRQVLRGHILQICERTEPLGAGIEIIAAALQRAGYQHSMGEIEQACRYLESKGLIQVKKVHNAILGITRHIAKTTAKGTDLLEGTITEQGIVLPDRG